MKIFRLILPMAMFFLFFATSLQAKELTQAERNDIAARLIPIYTMLLLDDSADTTAPQKPTLTETPPSTTNTSSVSVEVKGEVGARVYLDGVKKGTIGSDGTLALVLPLALGDNSFAITLKDAAGNRSSALNVHIKRIENPLIPANMQFSVTNHQSVIGSLDIGNGYAVTLSENGNIAYLADGDEGIKTIDVSNPTTPIQLGILDTDDSIYASGYSKAVVLSPDGKTVYLSDGYEGLKIIDVSNPANSTPLATIDIGNIVDVILSSDGTTVYIANSLGSLEIIDVSNPSNPTKLSNTNNKYTEAIALSPDGKIVYVINGAYSLKIIDISDPTNPTELSVLDTIEMYAV